MPIDIHQCCDEAIKEEVHLCSIARYCIVKGCLINEKLPPNNKFKVCQTSYSRLRRYKNKNKRHALIEKRSHYYINSNIEVLMKCY